MVKGATYMVKKDGLTLGGGHTMQYKDYVSQKYALQTYMTPLTNVTTINLLENTCKKIVNMVTFVL